MPRLFSELRIWFLGALAAVILRVLGGSIKWELKGEDLSGIFDETPVLFAFWHRKQLMMGEAYKKIVKERGRGPYMLSSRHPDGRIIAQAVKHLGIRPIFGSSTRGGASALRALLKKLREGWDVAVTPDGPRGPIFRSKAGVYWLAKSSGAKIIPCSFATSRHWEVGSWDRMVIPKPFSRGVFYVGAPITIPSDGMEVDEERALAEIDAALNRVEQLADSHFANTTLRVPA